MSGFLSGLNAIVSAGGSLVNDVARLGQTFGGSRMFDTSTASWASGSWSQQLQPGSWRGVPFVLDSGDTAAGRRVAIHEYPYRGPRTWGACRAASRSRHGLSATTAISNATP
jgi:DNA circularisation protein N-terminus